MAKGIRPRRLIISSPYLDLKGKPKPVVGRVGSPRSQRSKGLKFTCPQGLGKGSMWVQWAKWGWHNQKSKGHDLRAASADEGCGVTPKHSEQGKILRGWRKEPQRKIEGEFIPKSRLKDQAGNLFLLTRQRVSIPSTQQGSIMLLTKDSVFPSVPFSKLGSCQSYQVPFHHVIVDVCYRPDNLSFIDS